MAVRATPEPDYRELVEGAGDMIYTVDLEGRFTYTNRALEQAGGWEPGELIGRHFLEILAPSSHTLVLERFRQGIGGHELTPFFEVTALRKDGSTLDVEVRAGNVYRDGKIVGRQGFCRDISELKRLQSEVTEKSQRLLLLEDQALAAMGLYRQLAELALGSGDDRATDAVQRSLLAIRAEKLDLTAQDLRIVELLAEGCSNAEIGERFHLSVNTVKDHVSRIMQRLGARTRAEVVGRAARKGLILPEE